MGMSIIVRNKLRSEIMKRSSSSMMLMGMRSKSAGAGTERTGKWYEEDYSEYRKSLYGGSITHKALLVDAVGTLLVPAQPTAQIYREIGDKYGVKYSEDEILNRYRWAYAQPWGRSRLRYVDDGRPFWQYIVSSSTGCSDAHYFEELYNYFMTDKGPFGSHKGKGMEWRKGIGGKGKITPKLP